MRNSGLRRQMSVAQMSLSYSSDWRRISVKILLLLKKWGKSHNALFLQETAVRLQLRLELENTLNVLLSLVRVWMTCSKLPHAPHFWHSERPEAHAVWSYKIPANSSRTAYNHGPLFYSFFYLIYFYFYFSAYDLEAATVHLTVSYHNHDIQQGSREPVSDNCSFTLLDYQTIINMTFFQNGWLE